MLLDTYGAVMKWKGKGRGIVNLEVLQDRYSHVVYCISDPDTNEVRSVGRTSNVMQRYTAYTSVDATKKRPSERDRWVAEMFDKGKRPEMQILSICRSEQETKILEPLWDVYFTERGNRLLNADKYPAWVMRNVLTVARAYQTMEERIDQLLKLCGGK